jgi:hypothetical protein
MRRALAPALLVLVCAGCSATPAPAATPSAASPTQTESWANEARAMRRTASTCLDVRQGFKGKKLVSRMIFRFSGGDVKVTQAESVKIYKGAKKWICPALAP